MKTLKKFLLGLICAMNFSLIAVAHAEEVDNYFEWQIKNLEDYQQYDFLFNEIAHDNGVVGMRDQIYQRIAAGEYFQAAKNGKVFEVYQKAAFGADFLDENLIELIAKLYLMSDELDAAEREIDFLSTNAQNNFSKIRALNLKSDLYNRKGNYRAALNISQEAEKLLQTSHDEKLNLINLSRAAQAYCGLGEFKKSLEIAENILHSAQVVFGKDKIETLNLMTILAENYLQMQNYQKALEIFIDEIQIVDERYEKNPIVRLQPYLKIAEICFLNDDKAQAEEILKDALTLANNQHGDSSFVISYQLYKEINAVAAKYLPENHPLVLDSAFGVAYANNGGFGNILQAIEFYKKNLPKFKKVYGENGDTTLDMMNALSDAYISLGRYSDAKKIIENRLKICQKHFDASHGRTVQSTIDLADVYYRMGKYKTADKLLEDIFNDMLEHSAQIPVQDAYKYFFTMATGARLRGDFQSFSAYLGALKNFFEEDSENPHDISDNNYFWFTVENLNEAKMLGINNNIELPYKLFINLSNANGVGNDPAVLKMRSEIAESNLTYGNLFEAERYANQILKLSRMNLAENNFCEWLALKTLSKVQRAKGDISNALEIDNCALQIAEKVCGKKSLERLQTLDSIAADYAESGNFAESIKIRERTLKEYKNILEEDDIYSLQMMTNLAETYVAAGRYADAVKLCDETLALQKVPVRIDNNLSIFPCVTEPVRIKAKAQKLFGDEINSYNNYKELIQVYEAKRFAMTNIALHLSSSEKTAQWFSNIVPVYKDAATVAVSEKIADKEFAFYCAEFCKGRNLIDSFSDVLTAKSYLLTPSEKSVLAENQKYLNVIRSIADRAAANDEDYIFAEMAYDNLMISADFFKSELREKYFDNALLNDGDENFNIWSRDVLFANFDINKNQAAIPQSACLIEFTKAADNSLLINFLRAEGEVQAVNISVDKKFFKHCELYNELNSYATIRELNHDGKYLWRVGDDYVIVLGRENAPSPDAEIVKDTAVWLELRQKISSELSEKFMPTFEKFAGNSSHWIISPDAELNLVPFETLNCRGKLLIENVNISYVPSLAVMNLMQERGQKNISLGRSKELLAMGDAIYGNTDAQTSQESQQNFFDNLRGNSAEKSDLTSLKWKNLDSSALELEKVSALFANKEILRRSQVTEKNLWSLNTGGELSKYKYLLFSTHGLFVPEMPEYSSIVLSQNFNDDDYDGYVTVGEWTNYDLRSDLVYLSACESGRGAYRAGEGIIGLPYALTIAGNKDTVMSLWKVKDVDATAEFISAVFEKLRDGKSEVEALNDTKREFLKQNDNSIWAAFLLYGI